VEKRKITCAFGIIVTLAIFLALVFTSIFSKRTIWPRIPSLKDERWQFIESCKTYCQHLDKTFNSSTIHLLSNTKWCKEYFDSYPDTPCKTPDKCYSQKVSEHCDGNNSFSPSDGFPEKVRVSCSFYLTTGELCNPDAIEDGWIKCCENTSLENCNCK